MYHYIIETWHDYDGQTSRRFIVPTLVSVDETTGGAIGRLREAALARSRQLARSRTNAQGVMRIRPVIGGELSGNAYYWRWVQVGGPLQVEVSADGGVVRRLDLEYTTYSEEDQTRSLIRTCTDNQQYRHGYQDGELVEYYGTEGNLYGSIAKIDFTVPTNLERDVPVRWVNRSLRHFDGGYDHEDFDSLCPRR